MPPPRLAFLILAHTDAPQVERLCTVLQPHAVFLHIDRRATSFPTARIAALLNVTLVQPSIAVHWADFSVIEASLALLEAARQHGSYDRYILLSGSCYPIKPLSAFASALAADPTREWIALTPITPGSHLFSLIARRWRMAPLVRQPGLDKQLRTLWNRISKLFQRDLHRETGMVPTFGSQWWALTHAAVTMILDFVRTHPAFVQSFRTTYAPDELFFHTIVANSAFGPSGIPVQDQGSATNQDTPFHLLASASDRFFTSDDAEFQRVSASNHFFIRKVSSVRAAALLDRIDRELLAS